MLLGCVQCVYAMNDIRSNFLANEISVLMTLVCVLLLELFRVQLMERIK